MTLALVGTLSTNKQSNTQKETKNTQYQHDDLRDNKDGNGFWSILLNGKPQNGFRDQKKETRHCRIRRHRIDQINTKKLIPARNSHITSTLNLITCVYMCIKVALKRPF